MDRGHQHHVPVLLGGKITSSCPLVNLLCCSCRLPVIDPRQRDCGCRICGPCDKKLGTCKKCAATNINISNETFKDRAVESELKKASFPCYHEYCPWMGSNTVYRDHIAVCPFTSPVKSTQPCSQLPIQLDHIPYSSSTQQNTTCIQESSCMASDHTMDSVTSAVVCIKPTGVMYSRLQILNRSVDKSCIPFMCSRSNSVPPPSTEYTTPFYSCSDPTTRRSCYVVGGYPKCVETFQAHKVNCSTVVHLQQQQNVLRECDRKFSYNGHDDCIANETSYTGRRLIPSKQEEQLLNKMELVLHNLQDTFQELSLLLQTLQATSYNGTFIWKIPEVSRRRDEAISGKTIFLYSPPFYTSRFGYKLCLRVYMNGDGSGKGTHLSFFVAIMKGEYDPLLSWPFDQMVTLMLLDQSSDKEHIIRRFRPQPTSASYWRPQSDMNVASGYPKFTGLFVLCNSKYVLNDVLFLKAQFT